MSEQLLAALSDRYRLERELGRGGMASVYLAEDLKHHRKVAIKVLRQDLLFGPERFLKEIELTAGLQHPHIVPLFDSGSADGMLYFVMPYIEGESLRARPTGSSRFRSTTASASQPRWPTPSITHTGTVSSTATSNPKTCSSTTDTPSLPTLEFQ
jgi:hypothetical protein